MLIRYTIPIDNYHNDGVFFKHIYVRGKLCPNKNGLKEILSALHDEEVDMSINFPHFGPFLFEYAQCVYALTLIDELPIVIKGGLIHATTHIDHPKWGSQPTSVDVINVIKLNDENMSNNLS